MLCLAETISAWPFFNERPHKVLLAVLQLQEKCFNPLTGRNFTSGGAFSRHRHSCPPGGIVCMQPFWWRMHRNPGAAHICDCNTTMWNNFSKCLFSEGVKR
jgi:hypothetical protein